MRLAIPVTLLLLGLGLVIVTEHLADFYTSPFPIAVPVPFNPTLARHLGAAQGGARVEVSLIPVEYILGRGETLSGVFSSLGLDSAQAYAAVEALAEYLDVRRLKAGDAYLAYFDPQSLLTAFEWTLGDRGRVHLERRGGGWKASFDPFERRVESRSIAGDLQGSLIESLERAGGSELLAYRMADVLQWDVDFNRDLRTGDQFEVLFEEIYLDGEYGGLGEIVALHYTNAGRRLEAYRFGGEGAYYDGEGRPLRKMFLRSPLPFSRVTSQFSARRFHPILKTHRPHYGVDYGAPVGTPVRVTAGGVVTFAGRNSGAGRMLKVRHTNGYLTAYLHLSRFAAGIRPGVRVRQGQVIGYVGQTGLATAPHLDYRVQLKGRWINPLSIQSKPAEPIPKMARLDFESWRDLLRASLEFGTPLPPESPGTTRWAEIKPEPAPLPLASAGR